MRSAGYSEGVPILLWIFLAVVGILIDIWMCVSAGRIAKRKGYDKIGYVLLTLFLGLIGLIITLCLPDINKNTHAPSRYVNYSVNGGTKSDLWKCKVCDQINKGGTYCPRCGHKRGT